MRIIRGSEIPFIPASHEDPNDPGVLKRVLATRNELLDGRVQMLNWARLPVASAFRSHYHEDMQEVFVILKGQVGMDVDGESVQLAAGDAIVIDPREIHDMQNESDFDVEYVVFGITQDRGGKTVVV